MRDLPQLGMTTTPKRNRPGATPDGFQMQSLDPVQLHLMRWAARHGYSVNGPFGLFHSDVRQSAHAERARREVAEIDARSRTQNVRSLMPAV